MAVKIAGSAGPNLEVESNTLAARVVIRPDDYGSLGMYQLGAVSGTIGAGMSANAPIYAFQYTAANLALVKRVIISAGNTSTGFTAGVVTFQLFAARSFTAMDTAGTTITPTSNSNKLRTNMATTGLGAAMIANTGANSAGTRTLDGQAMASISSSVTATAGTPLLAPYPLLDQRAGDYPLVCAQNEGFVIQGTVPATGTWVFSVVVHWEELSTYGTGLAA